MMLMMRNRSRTRWKTTYDVYLNIIAPRSHTSNVIFQKDKNWRITVNKRRKTRQFFWHKFAMVLHVFRLSTSRPNKTAFNVCPPVRIRPSTKSFPDLNVCIYVLSSKITTHKTSCQKDSKAQRRLQLPATKMSRTNISNSLQYDRN